jgi:competence protein ComEA
VRAAASGTFRALGLVSEARVAAGGAPRSVGLVSDVRATANGVPRSVGLVSDVRAAASGTFRTLAPEARTRAAASGMSAEAAPISAAAADAAVARAATSALIQGRLASAAGAQPGNLSAVHALASSRHHSPTPQPCLSHGAALSNAPPSAAVIVDVEGKVAHPGVLSLPVGARVYEAVAAAGGALAGVDATALDLARPVVDGEQLRVGIAGEAAGPVVGPSGAAKGKRKGGRVVNLNTATVEELQAVPGVGPAMAERILEWRAAHGGFTSVGQLRQVRGIGERKFAEMRDSVTV